MTPDELRRRLDRVLLMDGAMGTQLFARGLERGQAPEGWLLEHPDRVEAAHRGYVEAGSDIIQTNTFGGTPPKLAQVGLGGRCEELCAIAVEVARRAAAPLVAGDIGPTGLSLPPVGKASEAELEDAFAAQASALAAAGADLLSIETMYDLREALAAVRAAAATGLAVLASMTFEPRKRGNFTVMGDRIGPSLNALAQAGATVVGFNCSVGSEQMVAFVEEARAATRAPIIAQPNAGLPEVTDAGLVYHATHEAFTADVMAMVDAGASVVGGCCGTDPGFIAALRGALEARS